MELGAGGPTDNLEMF